MDLSTTPFTYSSTTPRVLFGSGILDRLPQELHRLGATKPLLICSPSRTSLANKIREMLEGGAAPNAITDISVLSTALVHNPSHVIDSAMATAVAGRDCLVSLGGGSAVGLGKALALRCQGALPHVTIPTTYSGSEMTPIIGETRDGKKVSTTDPKVLPTVVIYDFDLTVDLPLKVVGPSGMNALAHAVEAHYAENNNPLSTLIAQESIRRLLPALRAIVVDQHGKRQLASADEAQREQRLAASLLYGAFLAGTAVATTGIALQHKLAHAAGGTLDLPHAETHALLLPHTFAYNARAMPEAAVRGLYAAFWPGGSPGIEGGEGGGLEHAVERLVAELVELNVELRLPAGLKEMGMEEGDIDRVLEVAFERPYWNPRELEREKIREVIRRAWTGEVARADL